MGVNELASDSVERDSKGATAPLAGVWGQRPRINNIKRADKLSALDHFIELMCSQLCTSIFHVPLSTTPL